VGLDGQENRLSLTDFKGASLIGSGDRLARFSGLGEDRDNLYTVSADGSTVREVVTFPDGMALRPGDIRTWGPQLHYLDGLDWYTLDVF
jgi:hypothetical protein